MSTEDLKLALFVTGTAGALGTAAWVIHNGEVVTACTVQAAEAGVKKAKDYVNNKVIKPVTKWSKRAGAKIRRYFTTGQWIPPPPKKKPNAKK